MEVFKTKVIALEQAYIQDGIQTSEKLRILDEYVKTNITEFNTRISSFENVSGVERAQFMNKLCELEEASQRRDEQMADTPRMLLLAQQNSIDALEAVKTQFREEISVIKSKISQSMMIEDDVDEIRNGLSSLNEQFVQNSQKMKQFVDKILEDTQRICETNEMVLNGESQIKMQQENISKRQEIDERLNKRRYKKLKKGLDQCVEKITGVEQKMIDIPEDEPNPDFIELKLKVCNLEEDNRIGRDSVSRIKQLLEDEQSKREIGEQKLMQVFKDITSSIPKEFVDVEEYQDLKTEIEKILLMVILKWLKF